MPAYETSTATTMEHNYSTSAPSVLDILMASSLARSRECTEKFSLCRFQSGMFDLKKMAGEPVITAKLLIKVDRAECEVKECHKVITGVQSRSESFLHHSQTLTAEIC